MRIVLQRAIPEDKLLRQQWNTLVQEMESPEVFYTYQWALAVSQSFKSSMPLLALAYDGEKLTGVAALATDPAQQAVTFLGGSSADYCDLVSHPDHRAEFLDGLLAELAGAGLQNIALTSIPAESATIKALRSVARTRGYRLFVRLTAVCAHVDLGSVDRVELKNALAKKKIFRHSMNSLGRQGPVQFRHLVTWESIEPVLAKFSVAHVARFLATGRISNVVSAQRRAFLFELARLLSESSWMVLSQMLVGELPVAWNYGFQFNGSWFWYQPTFATSYERLSPGYCLLSKIISEACDNPETRVVDLGLGAEGYKERFANHTRSTLHADLTKSVHRHAREIARYSGAQALKSVPEMETVVRRLIAYVGVSRKGIEPNDVPTIAEQSSKWLARWRRRCGTIHFYQWMEDLPGGTYSDRMKLLPLDLETSAVAAMSYEKDGETLGYLLGSAVKVQSKTVQGFALVDPREVPASFCWVSKFEGFEMKDLKSRLGAPSQNAALICDCWTPRSARGRGYYEMTLSMTARQISKAGNEPWIFIAASDHDSIRAIEAAGFGRRYSMLCKRTMLGRRMETVAFDETNPTMEARTDS